MQRGGRAIKANVSGKPTLQGLFVKTRKIRTLMDKTPFEQNMQEIGFGGKFVCHGATV
ncbi:hypothetical protein LBMAG20_08500 [Methylocystaceae bacterium]|jgi:hypothetical protein|nr:hypothetical protein LBMAG20_08500 [Methylocystaceae bacterium]